MDLDILYCRTATPEERLGSGFRPLPYIEDQDLVPHVRQSIKKSNLLNYSGYSVRRTDPVFVKGRIRIQTVARKDKDLVPQVKTFDIFLWCVCVEGLTKQVA